MQSSSNTIRLNEELIIEDHNYFNNSDGNLNSSGIGSSNLNINQNKKNLSQSANESKGKTKLEESLTKLVRLIANVTESYSSAIFVSDTKNKVLHSLAHHSLSRDYIDGVSIPYGRGLVGWTAENKVRITVSPFEHDSSTLLYYPNDQGLKSFIAVPVLSEDNEVIGVIACDSKKSYAFPKLTEKILTECASQVELLIRLHQSNEALSKKRPDMSSSNALSDFIENLRSANSESALFETFLKLPQSILKRDALIALVTSSEGYGEASFYTEAPDTRVEHHLMDLVCKNKKIISSEKSVHVLPSDDIRARSFLSVPFHVYGKEAGALNILSAPFEPFMATEIQTLEKIAKVITKELEHHRSKVIAHARKVGPSLLPWKHFMEKANAQLFTNPQGLSLLRIQLDHLCDLEAELGIDTVCDAHEQLIRFVQQLAPNPMLVSAPYGTSVFIFGPTESINSVETRLKGLIAKIHCIEGSLLNSSTSSSSSQLLLNCLSLKRSVSNKKTKSLNELIKLFKEDATSSYLNVKESRKENHTPKLDSLTTEKNIELSTSSQHQEKTTKNSSFFSSFIQKNEASIINKEIEIQAKADSTNAPIIEDSVKNNEVMHSAKSAKVKEIEVITLDNEVLDEYLDEYSEEVLEEFAEELTDLKKSSDNFLLDKLSTPSLTRDSISSDLIRNASPITNSISNTFTNNTFTMGGRTQLSDKKSSKDMKSIEEFILGDSAAAFKDKKNDRFW